jgi:hypothetical protein
MSKNAKQVVQDFYQADLLQDETVLEKYFHPEAVLIWNSMNGLTTMQNEDLEAFFLEIRRTYFDLRIEVSHLLADENFVTIRYKYYVKTIENPEEELGIAHFMGIWEVRDGKLYKGYQISQPVTDNDDTSKSYSEVKV